MATTPELPEQLTALVREWDTRAHQLFRSESHRGAFAQCAGELDRLLRGHTPGALTPIEDPEASTPYVDGIR